MTAPALTPKKRIDSIDILRGIVMLIMAIDHARDFFEPINFDPTDLTHASTALFLTRFITHYCATTFVFLAGTGAFLYLNRGKTRAEAFRFLASRGLWLVLLELTVVHWGWGGGIFLQVIWAIGVSMLLLAFLIYLPKSVIALIGLALIFGHDIFDHINTSAFTGGEKTAWTFLHVQGTINLWSGANVFVMYPLIPWVGVMATGYCFGTLFTWDAARRKKWLLTIGWGAIALFIIIRYFNFYGDAAQWTPQGNLHRTVLSFINVSKYPPSLDYLLITLGPGMLLLAWLENAQNAVTNILVVFGRVPLFYYILHLYLLHLMAIVVGSIAGQGANNLYFELPYVYLFWLFAITVLYFPCRWFMKYKKEHKQWWLGYL